LVYYKTQIKRIRDGRERRIDLDVDAVRSRDWLREYFGTGS
jgi:hypothetical protein